MAKKNFKGVAAQFISEETRQEVDGAQEIGSGIDQQGFTIPTGPTGYRLAPEPKSERLQLLIQPTTKAAIKEIAADKNISVNELVNDALKDYIAKERG